jgi:hypothetical protein
MFVRQCLSLLTFVSGATLAGLAAIQYTWLHPAVISPFALMIGMTPLVLIFAYSIYAPGYWFPVGLVLAAASWLWIRRKPIRATVVMVVILSGGALMGYGLVTFVVVSAHYNVGMAGEIPPEWYACVRPATKVGEIGLVLLSAGAFAWATVTDSNLVAKIVRSARNRS